jgi:hypothetical protein
MLLGIRTVEADSLADCIGHAEVPACEGLAHHDHLRRLRRVAFVEHPPKQHRNSERLKVAGTGPPAFDPKQFAVLGAIEAEVLFELSVHWEFGGDGRALHPGERGDALAELLEHGPRARHVIVRVTRVGFDKGHTFRTKANTPALGGRENAHRQHGAGQ